MALTRPISSVPISSVPISFVPNATPSSILLFLVGLFTLYYITSSILARRRLRAFKGPIFTSFSYAWLLRAIHSDRMGDWLTWANDAYGPGRGIPSTVRIGPYDLATSDAEFLRRISSARSRYNRSNWYATNRLDPNHDSMLSITDTPAHDRLKAKTASGYAGKENPGLEGDIDSVLGDMVGLIRDKYARGQGKLLDLATISQYFTLDSITKVAFGHEFGFLRKEEDVYEWVAMTTELGPAMVTAASIPYLAAIMSTKFMMRITGPKPGDKRGFGRILPVAREIVSKRFAPGVKDQKDMLGSFVRHGLTQTEAETESVFQMLAGSDTTATAIRATMLYVMTNPRVYYALRTEIDQAIQDGRISTPITATEGGALPYLQAVIQEGLRIHPPFSALLSKVVPPEGDYTTDGVFVPAGTRISPSIFALCRNRAVFGADADIFRPERWLEATPEGQAEMKKSTDLIFGHGRWMCPGKTVGFLELNKVFVELLRHFDLELAYPERPWKSTNYNLFLQKDMWVKVTEREGNKA
ncbi:cytochrome P450 [Bombardia bombarda]|uniref:Cytochrome P450 monooxygenase ABA1 n=1 Tax=Bombardia bombarda TaxID=252184 RepID=A0AA39U757_9PEZI|nr:cytochrome P450 [Bombardia bombarda]